MLRLKVPRAVWTRRSKSHLPSLVLTLPTLPSSIRTSLGRQLKPVTSPTFWQAIAPSACESAPVVAICCIFHWSNLVTSVQADSRTGSNTLSYGDGLEREVLTILAKQVTSALPTYFVSRMGDNAHTLSCPPLFPKTDSRKQELGVLGAIVSLCLMSGIPVGGIDGAWLVYLLNGCEFCSLDRGVIEAFHPDLAGTLVKLISCGPSGDLTPAAVHLDIFADIKVWWLSSLGITLLNPIYYRSRTLFIATLPRMLHLHHFYCSEQCLAPNHLRSIPTRARFSKDLAYRVQMVGRC